MDFALTQEQEDVKALAAKILSDLAPIEKLPSFEQGQDWYDDRLWQELAKANLLGVGLPADVGGLGMGLAETCTLLEELGRWCAPVPVWPTLVLGAMAIDEFGTEEQRHAILPEVVAGRMVLTAALAEEGLSDPQRPACEARDAGDGWTLHGRKAFVPAARLAGRVLVPARTEKHGIAVFLIDPKAQGVGLEAQAATTGEYHYRVHLDGIAVGSSDLLGKAGEGKRVVDWIVDRGIAGLCAMEVGVAERALRMAAEYTSSRKQFGKPIATFQAVAQRAADAYIDLEAVRLATWQAIWRLANRLPARRELEIAKFWASEGGHRVCYAAQHLHGGIGVDTDYPLHHYYLLSRQIEMTLGGTHTHLAALGRRLAETPAGTH